MFSSIYKITFYPANLQNTHLNTFSQGNFSIYNAPLKTCNVRIPKVLAKISQIVVA